MFWFGGVVASFTGWFQNSLFYKTWLWIKTLNIAISIDTKTLTQISHKSLATFLRIKSIFNSLLDSL